MNFFKIIILITLIIFSSRAFADTQKENSELLEQVKEITKELEDEKKPEVDTNRVVLDEDEDVFLFCVPFRRVFLKS